MRFRDLVNRKETQSYKGAAWHDGEERGSRS